MSKLLRLASVTLLMVPETAFAQETIGYVAAIDGPAQLLRAGRAREPLLGESVLRGDLISTSVPASVRVETRSGSVVVCGRAAKPSDCKVSFQAGHSVLPVGDWWTRAVTMVGWTRTNPGNLLTRDSAAPAFLIGKDAPQKLVAGKRTLSLAWVQGRPPYAVRLSGGGRLIAETSSAEQAVVMPELTLPNGEVVLTIEDGEKRRVRATFVAVPAGPKIPVLDGVAVNREHQALLEAAWLANQDDGAWLLEAYQRLNNLGPSAQTAVYMRQAILFGDRP